MVADTRHVFLLHPGARARAHDQHRDGDDDHGYGPGRDQFVYSHIGDLDGVSLRKPHVLSPQGRWSERSKLALGSHSHVPLLSMVRATSNGMGFVILTHRMNERVGSHSSAKNRVTAFILASGPVHLALDPQV